MKKFLAILLALCMILALVACGGGDDADAGAGDAGGSTAGSGDAATGGDDAAAGGDDVKAGGPAVPGYFDPEYDYLSGPKYKVAYLSMQNDFLSMEFDAAFALWAPRLNIEYTNLWCPVSGSIDEFISGMQTFADQGYDGLLLTPDSTIFNRIVEVTDELGLPWWPVLGQARDYTGDGRLFAPSSGYDASDLGSAAFYKLLEWKEENWPDVPQDKVGYIANTWSVAPEIHERYLLQERLYAEMFPEFGEYNELMTENPAHFFYADAAAGNADQATVQNLCTQIISTNPDYEVWLIAGAVDFYALGAAAAADTLGIADRCCITSSGGSALREQADNGVENAWRYAYAGPAGPFTEVPINALYAFMGGYATFETIYPEWVDPADKGDVFDEAGNLVEEHNFAKVLLASEWISADNYKEFYEWSDYYSFGDVDGIYPYEKVTDRELYSAFMEIPEGWGA